MAQNPHRFYTIVDANGWDVLLNKSALAVALDQCALPNSGRAWTRWSSCDILWFTLPESGGYFAETCHVSISCSPPQPSDMTLTRKALPELLREVEALSTGAVEGSNVGTTASQHEKVVCGRGEKSDTGQTHQLSGQNSVATFKRI